MARWLAGFLDRCFVLFGAVFFAQAPLFIQQYAQQLAARASELKVQVEALRRAARLSGKTVEQLIQKFVENPDGDFSRQGEAMQSLLSRWQDLQEAFTAIQESAILSRPFSFLYHCDAEIFSSTFHHFSIGLPLNLEGAAYALIGMGVGYLSFACLKFFYRSLTFKHKINKSHNQIRAPK